MPADQIDRHCRDQHPDLSTIDDEIAGCIGTAGRLCVIILPHPATISPEDYAAVARHELAHCSGWFHD